MYQAGNETAKASQRRQDSGFYEKYIKGRGIDIGHGGSPITKDCDGWEIDRGDATKLVGIPDGIYDWVYSSHLLEHLEEPEIALSRWWDIIKPGGYLIVAVPDEDAYERGEWPSTHNPDHKFSYTIKKNNSLFPKSKNLSCILGALDGAKIEYIITCKNNNEYQIEAVVQKVSVVDESFKDSFLGSVLCPTCNKDKMLFRGFYKNGNLLVKCILCGQSLVLGTAEVLQQCGFTVSRAKILVDPLDVISTDDTGPVLCGEGGV